MKKLALFLLFIVLSAAFFVFFLAPPISSNQQMTIHFLDVGQADSAILICDGEVLMIDGGSAKDSSFIYSYLKNTLGIDHIDHMIATHPHDDHIGGLAGALNACTVSALYSPVGADDSKAFASLKKYADRQSLSIRIPTPGETFFLGSAKVQFLSPSREYESMNDLSLVVRVSFGDTSFLFAGDAEYDAERDMLSGPYSLDSTLLKAGHHGSNSSSSHAFLREVSPQYAVISVGRDNSYGHPAGLILSRLADTGAVIYRTDLHGTIICQSDGKSLTFQTEKVALESSNSPAAQISASTAPYIANRNTKKLHIATCPSVAEIKAKNILPFSSKDEALNQGYVPCKSCNP